MLAETLDYLGPDRVMFGSDFPHLDHAADIVGSAMALPIGREHLAKVLWGNATNLLGIT
jgi:uncharacterized protein